MISYELAKQLKNSGFPQKSDLFYCQNETWEEEKQNYVIANQKYRYLDTCWGMGEIRENWCVIPTLSELIEACGKKFGCLIKCGEDKWRAYDYKGIDGEVDWSEDFRITSGSRMGGVYSEDITPEEAVAKLWLELNK